ncbi:glycosyltransferase family 2 protein [Intrasporangium calvum]|uniref:glycosyltransferase family 2 protein n=1 Tax=Intrasporangium calvum TaxID=53358 RepID=UPI000DF6101F|nr:glycosyltransferase family 2 protein [Intrasporangium calvum]AXG14084.1 glycosyltransferase family 2 protein [Intrasporangium calvum]
MRLSVIIPTYNVAPFIGRTIGSLVAQCRSECEIIVVDDGSDDATVPRVIELLSGASEVRSLLISQPNAGVSAARNVGLRNATGDYLLFLDGDDFVAPELLSRLQEVMQGTEPDIVCWGFDTKTPDLETVRQYFAHFSPPTLRISGVEALTQNVVEGKLPIWTGSAAYRTSFLRENGLDFTVGCHSGEDREFIYKSLSRAQDVFFIPEVLSFYLARPGSITRSGDLRQFDSVQAHLRTYGYLAAAHDAKLERVAETILRKNAIGGYFRHLDNCMNFGEWSNILELLAQVDDLYPGLNQEVRQLMKRRLRTSRKPPIGTALFLVSPNAFWRIKVARRRLCKPRIG